MGRMEAACLDPRPTVVVAPDADRDEGDADRDHERREERDQLRAGPRGRCQELGGGDAEGGQRQAGPEPGEERPLVREMRPGPAVRIG